MKPVVLAAAASAFLAISQPASAQFAKPEDAVKYRKAALTVMGTHFSRLSGMAQGKIPFDAKAAADNAGVVEATHKLPWAGFTADTQGIESRAKAEIWSNPAKFQEAQTRLITEVPQLVIAARGGKLDDLKAAVANVGSACKNCHDSFRQ